MLYPWVSNDIIAPVAPELVAQFRERYALPDRFWLYLGGYDIRKNVEFLLEAYAEATRVKALPPLLLAGNIPTQRAPAACDVIGTLKRLQLNETQIHRPGLIAADDLPVLYQAASLLIYPSLMEGFGLPPAEAMAAGTPVLASNASSLPEVVRKRQSASSTQPARPV